jgi:hypothetical protein
MRLKRDHPPPFASPTTLITKKKAKSANLKHCAARLAKSHRISKKQAEAVLREFIGELVRDLKKGDRVRIPHELGDVILQSKRAALKLRAYRPPSNAFEPSPRAQALLRGKEISENDLKANHGAYTLEDVQTLLGISRQAIDKKVRENALLAVPGPHGRRRYPVVQFSAEGILPGLDEVLNSLPSANGWFRFNFLVNDDSHLNGRRPIDVLKEGKVDLVVRAARAVGVQGA